KCYKHDGGGQHGLWTASALQAAIGLPFADVNWGCRRRSRTLSAAMDAVTPRTQRDRGRARPAGATTALPFESQVWPTNASAISGAVRSLRSLCEPSTRRVSAPAHRA